MPLRTPQTLANHHRYDPWFHFTTLPLLVVCFCLSIYLAVAHRSTARLCLMALSTGTLLLAVVCRRYALKIQDRVIRLEERTRLSALLPESFQKRLSALSGRQLIALRFAADEEIPPLVERTLREDLDAASIKRAIQCWRPDYDRV